jgi:uncharacterized protein YbaP (TraB family)
MIGNDLPIIMPSWVARQRLRPDAAVPRTLYGFPNFILPIAPAQRKMDCNNKGATMLRTFAAAMSLLLLTALPALAEDVATPSDVIPAHPVLWHIKGPHGGQVTLFGSLHMLPANTSWLTPDIWHAVAHTDVFVFEVATDTPSRATLNTLIDAHGHLPQGESLRTLLPPDAQTDYDTAITTAHLSHDITDHEQPWLVSLQLRLADSMNKSYFPDAGVDYVLMNWAKQYKRSVRYLETVDQQVLMLAPTDNDLHLDEFESGLKHVGHMQNDLDPLITAWSHGDEQTLGTLMDVSFAANPRAKKVLVTDRNRKWAGQIEKMLNEDRSFFITVGAAHLAGPDGVPALLRADGYEVDGP